MVVLETELRTHARAHGGAGMFFPTPQTPLSVWLMFALMFAGVPGLPHVCIKNQRALLPRSTAGMQSRIALSTSRPGVGGGWAHTKALGLPQFSHRTLSSASARAARVTALAKVAEGGALIVGAGIAGLATAVALHKVILALVNGMNG